VHALTTSFCKVNVRQHVWPNRRFLVIIVIVEIVLCTVGNISMISDWMWGF
jgi:hypothetical protein